VGPRTDLDGHGGEEKISQLPPELEPPIIQPVTERYITELFLCNELCSLLLMFIDCRHKSTVSKPISDADITLRIYEFSYQQKSITLHK
jgi:hypothetical protein